MYSNSCTPRTEFTRCAARINRVAMTNTGVLSSSSDSTVMTRSLRSVLPDRTPRADDDADDRAQQRSDDQKPQADPDAAPEFR